MVQVRGRGLAPALTGSVKARGKDAAGTGALCRPREDKPTGLGALTVRGQEHRAGRLCGSDQWWPRAACSGGLATTHPDPQERALSDSGHLRLLNSP